MHRVAIGTTTGHDYAFLVPFASLLWRERIGYSPVIFLVGNDPSNPWKNGAPGIIYQTLRNLGFRLEMIDKVEGVQDATVAQSIRHHAAALDFDTSDILIPSDADIMPFRKDFYYQHEKAVTLYYYNGYPGEEEDHWPTCHQSASVGVWREILSLDPMRTVRDNLLKSFEEGGIVEMAKARAADPKNWQGEWFFDEHFSSKKIKQSRFYPDQIHKIARRGHPPADRLDRANRNDWKNYSITTYTDAHSIRPAWNVDNWPMFRPLVEQALPGYIKWADEYRTIFHTAMGVDR